MPETGSFQDVLAAAIQDMLDNGFDSVERVQRWTRELRMAADRSMVAPESVEDELRRSLAGVYRRMVDRGGLVRFNPGVERYTLDRIRPALRAELDRRIMASADLIRLNREQAIDKTLQRFSGWSTSIPKGGTTAESKARIKRDQKKALGSLPFEERRLAIDQGHKLISSLNDIVATDGGAIAAVWRSHWRQAGYDYREDHKDRDEKIFLIRGSWAHRAGLVKPGKAGYTDDVTAPAQEPFCQCYYVYLYALRDLPADMLTAKGRNVFAAARGQEEVRSARYARGDSIVAEDDAALPAWARSHLTKEKLATGLEKGVAAGINWLISSGGQLNDPLVKDHVSTLVKHLRDAGAITSGSAKQRALTMIRNFQEAARQAGEKPAADALEVAAGAVADADAGKATKAEAGYVGPFARRPGAKRCDGCTMFRAPLSCTAVESSPSSPIDPGGYCNFHESVPVRALAPPAAIGDAVGNQNAGICHAGRSGPGTDPICGTRNAYQSYSKESFRALPEGSQCKKCAAQLAEWQRRKEEPVATLPAGVTLPPRSELRLLSRAEALALGQRLGVPTEQLYTGSGKPRDQNTIINAIRQATRGHA